MIAKDPTHWLPSWESMCDFAAQHHRNEAAPIYENLAVLHYGRNDTLAALRALVKAVSYPMPPVAKCRVLHSAVTLCRDHPTFPPAECAALIEQRLECESETTQEAQRNVYMLWLHKALHANSSSPELQYLWAELLTRVGRASESAPHYQAAVQLYMDKNRYKVLVLFLFVCSFVDYISSGRFSDCDAWC